MKRFNLHSCVLALTCLMGATAAMADVFIIVNAGNSMTSITPDEIDRVFLKKTKRFENGMSAEPVMQAEGSRQRALFNKAILGRDEQQLKYYWSRKMFSGGDRPPPTVATEADVITVVAEKPGAIGYVTARPKDARVKVVYQIKE